MTSTTLTILHFNDVYNIEPRANEPVGGAARQTTAFRNLAHLNPLVLFSGDALNPSTLSTVTRGKHMVPILNAMKVKCAVYGNHDFDYGIETLLEVHDETDFPWLISNVVDADTGQPLANGLTKYKLEWNGIQIGLLGIVEEEWIHTLAALDKDDLLYKDFTSVASGIVQELREKENCDIIIALTHMRWPNDIRLRENVAGIDLILGGHDHDYTTQQVNGKWIVKSGTDFQTFSHITMVLDKDKRIDKVDVVKVDVDSSLEEADDVKTLVDGYLSELSHKMELVLGVFDVELEGRFAKIRTQETNLGNFFCDIMLSSTDADIAMINSGTLRSDRVHPRGEFTMKDLMTILPMLDPCVVLELTGAQVLETLENGVSQYPKLEGRFPQVAGLMFGFNPQHSPGHRVEKKHVHIGGKALELDEKYRLVTKSYMMAGKDGYDVLKDCKVLVDEEDGPLLTTIIQNHFDSLKVVQGLDPAKRRRRRSSLILARRHSSLGNYNSLISLHDMNRSLAVKSSLKRQENIRETGPLPDLIDGETNYCHLMPANDGRIFIVTKERPDDLAAQTAQIAGMISQTRIVEAQEPSEEKND